MRELDHRALANEKLIIAVDLVFKASHKYFPCSSERIPGSLKSREAEKKKKICH